MHEYNFDRKRGTIVFPYVFSIFVVLCEETGAGCVEYSGERITSTS
jgi:hypothetical protein